MRAYESYTYILYKIETVKETRSYWMNLISHSNWIEGIHSIADVFTFCSVFNFKSLFLWFDFFIVRNLVGIVYDITVDAKKRLSDLQFRNIVYSAAEVRT